MTDEKIFARTIVRKPENKKAIRQFMLYTVAVFIIGITAGFITGRVTKTTEEYTMERVNSFGAYDHRIMREEPKTTLQADFKPLDCSLAEEHQEFIYSLCKAYDIDFTLVMALIQKESDFRIDTISETGDYGLMQINKINHKWIKDKLGVTDFLDAEQNVRAGVFILRKLFEEYTDTTMVLMAYNMGEDGASRLWKNGIYETPYTTDILKIQAEMKGDKK